MEALDKLKEIKEPDFTPKWLRRFNGFEDISDNEAREVLKILRTLAHVTCVHLRKKEF